MRLLLAVLAVAAALAAGIYIGANPGTPVIGDLVELVTGDDAAVDTDVARDLIKNDFYKPVPDSTLRDGSIDGMVKALKDPYTQYLSPAHNKLFQQAISGKYSGVGMGVDDDKRGLLVTFTYPGSPARKAGVKPGDVITKVNGKSIVGVPSEAAVARIKGPENTEVTLTIRSPRGGGQRLGPEHDLRLKRKQIEIPVTTGKLDTRNGRKVGVVRLAEFTETSGAAVAHEVSRLKKQGADSYVLDLRGNGGGRVDQAVAVTSLFLNKGMVVATEGRTRERQQYNVRKRLFMVAKPLVVLVDRGSASASEIVAGALKFNDRALVVGTRTFGKGSFQELTPLKNGGAVKLTVGQYYLPGNRTVGKNGIRPDLKVSDNPKTRPDEALDASFRVLAKFKKP